MAGLTSAVDEMTKNKSIELNNNDLLDAGEVTAAGGGAPEEANSGGGGDTKFEKQRSLQDLYQRNKGLVNDNIYTRGRSNSDGAAAILLGNVSPLTPPPNTVLDKMGLHGDVSRERWNEETLEQKFMSLALSFTIDSGTIKDRCERQRRTRDQTESNFNIEVDRLREKLALLQPFCTDFERAELLSMLFSQVDTLTKAASLVSISAERYGAVQHEDKLTDSVQLMVTHVQALKQQRDSARRQLQYTKRVLQEPIPQLQSVNSQKSIPGPSKRVVCKRRASMESVNSQQDQSTKLNRRISDLSFRASLPKSNRPSRLDLGLELKKIKEMSGDETVKEPPTHVPDASTRMPAILREDSDFDLDPNKLTAVKNSLTCKSILKGVSKFLRQQLMYFGGDINAKLCKLSNKWSENDYLYALLNSCAVLCFSISILTLVSLFLEQGSTRIFWFLTGNNNNNGP
ncbi:uncharacterized protein LOC143205234 [Rhynchophorus ferrugineus]|uniref:uncharacterized protein LOC143205234 n=1 Tax=Rhynchophorus ferrugineus TaxID=354439 RepID=UPI003FCE1384